MKRIFSDYAYGAGPRDGCFWDTTCDLPTYPALDGRQRADVVIVGAGFTGLNAALTLAEQGVEVVVLDAQQPGWGASGRNGGFCCLGGGKASDAFLDRHFGQEARRAWRKAEMTAVDYVEARISQHGWSVDRHSTGETLLAHRPMSMGELVNEIADSYGLTAKQEDLRAFGGAFHGALRIPYGFGMNPRKYIAGLLRALESLGVRVFGNSAARFVEGGVRTSHGVVHANLKVIATNGYSSEDVSPWLAGRYMPTQSNVMVTRPLTNTELSDQGWSSGQMCYDTRNLLHYFRLMPDNRFLFGMRGGLRAGPTAEAHARKRLRAHFDHLFPAWRHVESEGAWSGFVALARGQMPFVGPVPASDGQYASLCYHGNGIAMGSYCGHLLAKLILGEEQRPEVLRKPLQGFPFGRVRRVLMPPIYAALTMRDGL